MKFIPLESLYIKRNSTSFGHKKRKFDLIKKEVGKGTKSSIRRIKSRSKLWISLSLLCYGC